MSIFDIYKGVYGSGKQEVLTIEADFEEIAFLGVNPSKVVEEDIELIIRKKRFRDIIEEIGVERFRGALEELYVREGATARVARVIGLSKHTMWEWYVKLDIPLVFRPPRVYKTEIIGWRRIPEIAYSVPRLYFEEAPVEERGFASGLVEGEGSHVAGWDVREKKYRPVFAIEMYDPRPLERLGKLIGLKPTMSDVEGAEGKTLRSVIHTVGSPAISIADYLLGHLTSESVKYKRAKRLLMIFRDRPSLPEEEYKKRIREIRE